MTTPARKGKITNPLFYYGAVSRAARERATTAQVWEAIRAQAESAGLTAPGISVAQVNWLRGAIGGEMRAARAFADLGMSNRITATQIGVAAYARSERARSELPIYEVRFSHTTLQDGEEITNWRMIVYRGRELPTTKSALLADVEYDAAQMADKYGVEHLGVSDVSILVV